jgi:hypothetical protein
MTQRAQRTFETYVAEHVAEVMRSPAKKFKDTNLGKKVAEWWSRPEKHVQLAMTLLKTNQDCRDKATQEVILDTLATLLHRDISFSQNHIDPLLQAVGSAESAERIVRLLPGVLAAVNRVVGLEPLAQQHQQALRTIQEKLRPADKRQHKNTANLIDEIEKLIGS